MLEGIATKSAPVLGEYADFRLYLRAVYDHRRQTEGTGLRPYSYSTFSAAADIKSPNYLKLIIEGRRNLSEDMMGRFARALRLSREETLEFKALVRYGQSMDPSERNQRLKELADLRAQREFDSGDGDPKAWDKVPGWIGWVLYAMADQAGVEFDPEKLQRLFRAKTPKATVELIRTMEIPHPSSLNPSVAADIDAVTLKALCKERDERYQTVGAFLGELSRAADALARRSSRPSPVRIVSASSVSALTIPLTVRPSSVTITVVR
jgi:hypothetical protein